MNGSKPERLVMGWRSDVRAYQRELSFGMMELFLVGEVGEVYSIICTYISRPFVLD